MSKNIPSLRVIVGIDEVGRGSLVGPVLAAALTIKPYPQLHKEFMSLRCVRDSKRMTPQKRKEVFKFLKAHPAVEWGIGRVSEKVIDKINIFQATKLAMTRAVKNLEKKIAKPADLLLIDGNFNINSPTSQKPIVKGDEKVFLIKLASIIAKVQRDRAMVRYCQKYPQYGFSKHKGYPTHFHHQALKKHGPCKLHRKTFNPVAQLLSGRGISKSPSG